MVYLLCLITLSVTGCTSDDGVKPCDSEYGISLPFESCLVFEDNGSLDDFREDIQQVIEETVPLINQAMSVGQIKISVRNSPGNVIPEIGMGGFNPNVNEVILSFDPGFTQLQESISTELAAQLAHEMHHAKRRRTAGYGASLLEALVSEGLADHFAIEVLGTPPPIWSTAVTGEILDQWIDVAKETWTNTPYNHNEWFFGSTGDKPRWLGYSIGYKLVKDYMAQHPERKASGLADEPAASFVPK